MPTNILRKRSQFGAAAIPALPVAGRVAAITIGRFTLRVVLADTATAARIWAALPLFSTAETWGDSIHFEIPVKSGRERNARLNVAPGDICFWSQDDRVLIAFGPTPISRPDEIRLMGPCNVWARALDDLTVLEGVTPGETVAIRAV